MNKKYNNLGNFDHPVFFDSSFVFDIFNYNLDFQLIILSIYIIYGLWRRQKVFQSIVSSGKGIHNFCLIIQGEDILSVV